ncbi:WD repeat-containing protein 17 [Triplophysa tibetana]|uniref:WD repeat-containing protein 17 n=1 Tax=Triplophysa tibetana TaxID=1572043 RepID=A0A5A9PII3_9TELE|nr:WD repeat-containing protein 17 [Triplophysa tibetana]
MESICWFSRYHNEPKVKMSQVKQVGLLAAGCQPWNKDVCAASGDRFAYCATLAIYVYQLDHRYNEFKLRAIMSEHKKTITAISWCPHNPDVFASASADNLLIIWNVAEQKAVARLDNTKGIPASLSWCWNAGDSVAFVSHRGPLYIWTNSGPDSGVAVHKEAHSFLSDICLFRWHPLKKGKVVFGHTDGSLSIFQQGTKNQKHVLRPESLEGTDEEDPVTALEWDPLSTDYLLVANMHNGIRLLDSESLSCITTFSFPSAAASVQCLAWVPSAPGMFITGAFSSNSPSKNHYTSSTSEAVPPPTLSQNQAFSLPPGHAVCCFMDGGVGLYDMGAKKWDFLRDLHGKNGIFCVAWSHKDSKRIATCSGDGFCIIRTIDGKVLHKYKHPAAVFGCDWSQNNKDMIATGCEDKNVRVYYLATSSDQPLKVFPGHTAKVFHVRWSPLREGILCSGSDDGTVRIWDYTQDACINVLSGHTAPVRGLMWNTEVPYLLTSGSWDYTIRVWDTRDGTCLDTVYDHGADVYGLTCHPSCPFTMASCSRDSTVRLWSLTPLIAPLVVNILTDHSWDDIIGNTDRAMVPGAPPLLCGKVSRDIKQELDKLSSDVRMKKLKWFSECFSSEAQELTIVKMSKFGGGIGAPSKEERLKNAAEIHIRLGQIQRYCELMVELGEWEKALSVAPGVSMKYWKKLMQRRADQLMQEGNDDVIPFCIATGEVKKLVNFFTSRGQLKEAVLVAQGACEGNIHGPLNSSINHTANSDNDNIEKYCGLLHRVCKELAEWYFQDGHAVLAACCHLAVDNSELAMASLIRGNELELAVCVGTVLGESASKATHYVLELLARKYMTTATWDLAARLLQMIPDNEILLAKLCAYYPGSSAEINDLHEKCGLPTLEECKEFAENAHAEGEIFQAVKYYLMSPEPEKALPIGISYVKEQLSAPDWAVDSVYHILDLLSYIRTDRLILSKCSDQLLKRREVTVPLPIEQLSGELEAWRVCTQSFKAPDESTYASPSEAQKLEYSQLLSRMREEPIKGLEGPDYVTGSNLPSHSDVQISCFTGLRIQGPVFFLEDGKSAISLNDALMWAKVNPFSPLGTGIRLNPF